MDDEGDSSGEIKNKQTDDFTLDNREFIPSTDGIFTTSTPRNKLSVSYQDITRLHEGSVSLSAASWQRMKGLSQSICDLKLLREKQVGRRQTSVLLEDDFIHEHARKLKEARMKIKALETKYCNPQRIRSNSSLSATERNRTRRDSARQRANTEGCEESGGRASPVMGQNPSDQTSKDTEESSADKETELFKEVVRRSLFEELSDDKSDLDSGISPDRPSALDPKKIRAQRKRPVTWAYDEDLYVSDSNSVSSYGSNRYKPMMILPEEGRDTENYRYCGYTGTKEEVNSNKSSDDCEMTLVTHRASNHTDFNQKPSGISNRKTKWQSMPTLATNHEEWSPQDRQMMYGEAIPVDPNDDRKKRNTRLGRKSRLYVVNASPEKEKQQQNKKKKFREKFFHKRSSLKFSLKCITVGSPEEAQSLGKVVGLHSTTEQAHIIELNRPANGSYGFHVQKSYHHNKNGIFISKISDKKAQKFFGGLIHVGDEVLEINNASIKDQDLSSVNKLIKNSEKLLLTILPYSSQKDQLEQ